MSIVSSLFRSASISNVQQERREGLAAGLSVENASAGELSTQAGELKTGVAPILYGFL